MSRLSVQGIAARLRRVFSAARNGAPNTRGGRRSRHLRVEPLEDRTLMSFSPTIAWDGGAGTLDGANPLNWTDDRLPNANDDVLIQVLGQQVNITLTNAVSVRSLQSEENLDVLGALSLGGDSRFTGHVSVAGGAALTVQPGAAEFLAGGSFTGAFNVAAGGTARLAGGDFGSGGGGTVAGTVEIGSGRRLDLTGGSFAVQAGASVVGPGRLGVARANLDVAGAVTVRDLESNTNANIGGAGAVTVTGTFDWHAGTMAGEGTTSIASGATLRLHGGAFGGRYLEGRTLTNAGTVEWLGDSLGARYASGVFRNLASGTVLAAGGYAYAEPSLFLPAALTFENVGTFRVVAGGGFAFENAAFNNTGTVEVQSGTLTLHSGSATHSFTVAAGATLGFRGAYTLAAGSSVSGAGSVSVTGGPVEVNGTYAVAGRTDILTGGGIYFNTAATTHHGSLSANAELGGTATLTVGGTFDWHAGLMLGPGTTAIAHGATLRLPDNVFAGRQLEGRTLTNDGTILWLGDRLGTHFGGHSVIRNTAQGVVQISGGYAYAAPVPQRSAVLEFENAGTFRVAGNFRFDDAAFTNSNTVDVQSGTLSLETGSATGTFTVAANAHLDFGGSYTLQQGASIRGAGLARVIDGSLLAGGDSTIENLQLGFRGSLDGPRKFTIAGTLAWVAGSMAGTGTTTIAPGGVLALLSDQTRALHGRKLLNEGGIFWDGQGAITRYVGSTPETYDNTAVPRTQPAAGGFNAEAAAAQISRAMHGGLITLGTKEETVYRILESMRPDDVERGVHDLQDLRNIYRDHYGGDLDAHLGAEFSGAEWTRVQALLDRNRPKADAAALRYAMFNGWGDTDEQTIWRVLERGPVAAISSEYQQLYGTSPPRVNALDADLQFSLDVLELQRALHLLGGNRAAADANGLRYAMYGGLGLDVDEDEIYRILRDRTPSELSAIRQEYQELYGENPHRDNALTTDFQSQLEPPERGYARALLDGNLIGAAVARLRLAFDQNLDGTTGDTDGTDEDAVWETLNGTRSDQRVMIAQRYVADHHTELRAEISGEFSDSSIYGDELRRTVALLDHGGLSDAQQLYFAMQGWGTDNDTIRAVLARRQGNIAQLRIDYESYTEGIGQSETLDTALWGDLWGRDYFDAQQALLGTPQTARAAMERALARYNRERTGWLNLYNNYLQTLLANGHGRVMDDNIRRAVDEYVRIRDAGGAEDPLSSHPRLAQLLGYVYEDIQTFREARDEAAELVANALGTVGGVLAVIGTGGAALPVVIGLAAGAGLAGTVLGRALVEGGYYWEQLPADTLTGMVNGGTAAITAGAVTATTRWGVIKQTAVTYGRAGAASGALAGVVSAGVGEETWRDGMQVGLLRVAQSALVSGLTGLGLSSMLTGSFAALRVFNVDAILRRATFFTNPGMLVFDPDLWRQIIGRTPGQAAEQVLPDPALLDRMATRLGGSGMATATEQQVLQALQEVVGDSLSTTQRDMVVEAAANAWRAAVSAQGGLAGNPVTRAVIGRALEQLADAQSDAIDDLVRRLTAAQMNEPVARQHAPTLVRRLAPLMGTDAAAIRQVLDDVLVPHGVAVTSGAVAASQGWLGVMVSRIQTARLRDIFRQMADPPRVHGVDFRTLAPQEVIARHLPVFESEAYSPTFGIFLDTRTGRAYGIVSGGYRGTVPEMGHQFGRGLFSSMDEATLRSAGTFFWDNRVHVEAQVAAFMRKHGITEGKLYINGFRPCQPRAGGGCDDGLNLGMLPPNARLTVHAQDGAFPYTGIPD